MTAIAPARGLPAAVVEAGATASGVAPAVLERAVELALGRGCDALAPGWWVRRRLSRPGH